MAYLDIHKAMTQSVIDLSLGLPIAYENSDFNAEKDGGDHFLSINVLYDEQNAVTKTGLDDVTAFMQISSFTKSGTSVKAMYSLMDTLNAAYPHARKITYGDQVINIQNISVNKRNNINGWYVTDFTIFFWTDLTRA